MKFMDAVRAQVKLAVHARTAYFLLALCTMPWIFMVLVLDLSGIPDGRSGFDPALLFSPVAGLMCVVFGTLWGVMAWRDEPPRMRFYHWSLPVDTSQHDLARIAAYLIWLVLGLSAYILIGILTLAMHGVPLRLGAVGVLPFVAMYLSGFTGFGIGAAFSTAFDRPAEYLIGSFILVWLTALMAGIYRFETILRVLGAVIGPKSNHGLINAVAVGGVIAQYRYDGITSASAPVTAPIALWLAISLASVIAASYYNRGRAR
ncbi:MAG: hypothetical protein ABIV28_06795 [Longimicrobiales bacterium]